MSVKAEQAQAAPPRTELVVAELDELEERPAKQLTEVRAERDELAVAERVLERVSEELADERASVAPAPLVLTNLEVKR
ncbi:hypothetical protein ACIQZB_41025 [Streptomyces sp. NPDC097727]|uniref:hypothetical protein n=1 Tax=Streptomyces sp. NPDC097727 TaxID=3366092 RepID=UPI003810910D